MQGADGGGANGLAVIVVTFRSGPVIKACLNGLVESRGIALPIVIADNASPDDTVDRVRRWAEDRSLDFEERDCPPGTVPAASRLARVTLLRSPTNLGYAGGVNLGLKALLPFGGIQYVWILNPDCVVPPETASALAKEAKRAKPFALLGSRTLYLDPPHAIQSDGGRVHPWTGVCSNLNQGRSSADTPPGQPEQLDFISGANMVASRRFVESAGPMREDYFLFYEEVDWAQRRGTLPLVFCATAQVYHQGGSATGSGAIGRRASPLTNYFNYRSRMRFLWRFRRRALPVAYAYAWAKALQLLLHGARAESVEILRGMHQLGPSAGVRTRIGANAAI